MLNKYSNRVVYIDFLFISLMFFVSLFMYVFMLINPIAKNADIVAKDQLMIELSWEDTASSDMDLWLKSPTGTVGFSNKHISVAYLDKDDLGTTSDVIIGPNGVPEFIRINREIVFIKKAVLGEYVVNVHAYTLSSKDTKPQNIRVNVIELLPKYRVLYSFIIPVQLQLNQEYTVAVFEADMKGENYVYRFKPLKQQRVAIGEGVAP